MATQQFVIFSLNNEFFGIEIKQVKEIIKPMDTYQVPDTPDFIEGLVNLRGRIHTIFNLRKKFKLPVNDYDDKTKIIIVNINNMMLGFTVDEVSEIITVDDEQIESAPNVITSLDRKYVKYIAKLENKIVLLLDLDLVLTVDEKTKLEEIHQEHANSL